MVKTEIYSIEQINGWGTQLKDLAKKPRTRFSKKQAVEALIDEIEEALEAHSYEEVAENLKAWGLNIAAGSLKQYVGGYRREHQDKADSPTHKRTSTKAKSKLKKAAEASARNKREVIADKQNGNFALSTHEQTTLGDREQTRATSRESARAKSRFTEVPEEL